MTRECKAEVISILKDLRSENIYDQRKYIGIQEAINHFEKLPCEEDAAVDDGK